MVTYIVWLAGPDVIGVFVYNFRGKTPIEFKKYPFLKILVDIGRKI